MTLRSSIHIIRLHLLEKPKNDVLEIDSSEDEQPHKTSSSPARKGKKAAMKPRVKQNSSSKFTSWTKTADVEQ